MEVYLTRIRVLGLYGIREILLHMLFEININVKNVLQMMMMMMMMMMMNWRIVFVAWLTDEKRLALFPAGIIVRNPHHCESPTRREMCSRETTRGFLKTERKSRKDYQCIMWGIKK